MVATEAVLVTIGLLIDGVEAAGCGWEVMVFYIECGSSVDRPHFNVERKESSQSPML